MKKKNIANNEFFNMIFTETERALAHLERIAKSEPFLIFGEQVTYPGLWRQDNGFVYISDFKTPRITHNKLHELLSKSSGLKDGWLPFVIGIEINSKVRELTVYGYGGSSPGSIRNFEEDEYTGQEFLKVMQKKYEYFSQWVDVNIVIGDKKIRIAAR